MAKDDENTHRLTTARLRMLQARLAEMRRDADMYSELEHECCKKEFEGLRVFLSWRSPG